MGGAQQPFLYEAERSSRSSVPDVAFDPKAVTRASWQPKPVKAKQDGPLVQLNRHPDAHEVIGGRAPVKPMTSIMKAWIKAMRVVQLLLRLLQLVGATGILVLIILLTNVPGLTTWVLRITAGFVIVHSAYGVYHLAKPAGYRTPASSSAYQVFAAFSDFCVLPLYAYGALAARNNSSGWSTLLSDKDVVTYLITAFYYTLIGAGSVHGATLIIAFWLAVKFRDIAHMPPDMNPLEDRYTSRSKKRQFKEMKQQKQQHARNKSSVATADTFESLYSLENDKGLLSRPPSVPFLHTRAGSQTSIQSRDPRLTLPSQSSLSSPARGSLAHLKRASNTSTPTSSRGAYAEIPLNDGGYSNSPASRHSYHSSHPGSRPPSRPDSRADTRPSSRPNTGTPNTSGPTSSNSPAGLGISKGGKGRQAKFTETWYTTDSLVGRTQERNQAINTLVLNASGKRRNYEVVSQAYDFHDSDGEESDNETVRHHPGALGDGANDENHPYDYYDYEEEDGRRHPNPLASNPTPRRTKTPYHRSSPACDIDRQASVAPSMSSSVHTSTTVLGEVPLNDRRVSGGYTADIADAMGHSGNNAANSPSKNNGRDLTNVTLSPPPHKEANTTLSRQPTDKRWTWSPRNRNSSIQPDEQFFSRPYGDLKSGKPPVMVGEDLNRSQGTRQISSGNDYDLGSDRYLYHGDNGAAGNTFGRRNVSGKIAEEGRANSRYSTLNN